MAKLQTARKFAAQRVFARARIPYILSEALSFGANIRDDT